MTTINQVELNHMHEISILVIYVEHQQLQSQCDGFTDDPHRLKHFWWYYNGHQQL